MQKTNSAQHTNLIVKETRQQIVRKKTRKQIIVKAENKAQNTNVIVRVGNKQSAKHQSDNESRKQIVRKKPTYQ